MNTNMNTNMNTKAGHKYVHKPSTDEVCHSIMLISIDLPSSLCELYLS